ncbi:hypothetical protein CTAYLR_000338 [Chrysophaeum taylorii]|uniref:COMM domain-containing protein 5 n=1 Tax=Chrysophaeum taylorii TaxID=2483200 RepID=A0AAD7UF70_9STRA|nr:hypothetical protein CTAYLR_000338 [Chrysophaeum taylorii]
MGDRAGLAAAARQSFEAHKYEQALQSLAALKDTEASPEDLKWVDDNIAEVKRAAASSAAPRTPRGVFPRIAGVKWRVDVAISTSHLERVMRPSVMMELTLSDSRVRTFEMNLEQFHKLRYSVARVLRNMQEIERNPIMRLCDS